MVTLTLGPPEFLGPDRLCVGNPSLIRDPIAESGYWHQVNTPYSSISAIVYGNSNQDDRLDDLMMRRADLESRWRALEEDARNARVPQKWLMP